jgi:hypothetical protein
MSREKVATVQTIERVEPIDGRDKVQKIILAGLGWDVVGGKDLIPGQKVVFIQYDTIISENQPWAEFLRSRCYSARYHGFKIKARELWSGGPISYGLVLKGDEVGLELDHRSDGEDLSEILHVTAIDDAAEYEKMIERKPPSKFQRFIKKYTYFLWKLTYGRKPKISGSFPSDCAHKTDETRIETLTRLLETAQGKRVYVTTKCDGQSGTFAIYKGRFRIASRNFTKYDKPLGKAIRELVPGKIFPDNFITVACKYSIAKEMDKYRRTFGYQNLTLQAEVVGPGIQKNRMGLNSVELRSFNLYDPDKKKFYKWWKLEDFCKSTKIPTVPFQEYMLWHWKSVKELKEYAKGTYDNGHPREGIVIRGDNESDFLYMEEAEKDMSNMWSVKVINDQYTSTILKEKDE